jgi:S-methylmethionine-dependent homocysteine/selenocysteine methylase
MGHREMVGVSDMHRMDARLRQGEVLLLDGAVGTQLQEMGAPMDNTAWAASALETHPYTVRRMHELYVEAGVDVITTNTYSSARHNLEPLALGDRTIELNLRAVALAQEARDRAALERPVLVAGSVSSFGIVTGGEPRAALHRLSKPRSAITADQAQTNLREQAAALADAGVDLLLAESTSGPQLRRWVLEACLSTGLPVWVGFKCRVDAEDPTVKVGYSTDAPLAPHLDEIMAVGGSAVTLFHSTVADTNAALPLVLERWSGPVGVYPEAERRDYTAVSRDPTEPIRLSPAQFAEEARRWVALGVQIVGGCCGIGVEYIRSLRTALPSHVPAVRVGHAGQPHRGDPGA